MRPCLALWVKPAESAEYGMKSFSVLRLRFPNRWIFNSGYLVRISSHFSWEMFFWVDPRAIYVCPSSTASKWVRSTYYILHRNNNINNRLFFMGPRNSSNCAEFIMFWDHTQPMNSCTYKSVIYLIPVLCFSKPKDAALENVLYANLMKDIFQRRVLRFRETAHGYPLF